MVPDLSFFPRVGVHHILCHAVTFTEPRLLLPTVGLNCLRAARSLRQTTLLFSYRQKRQQVTKVRIPLVCIMSLNGLVVASVKAEQQQHKKKQKNPIKIEKIQNRSVTRVFVGMVFVASHSGCRVQKF